MFWMQQNAPGFKVSFPAGQTWPDTFQAQETAPQRGWTENAWRGSISKNFTVQCGGGGVCGRPKQGGKGEAGVAQRPLTVAETSG